MKKSRKGSFKNENTPPQRRQAALWGWLPAFRATAETGSLSAAARMLEVSPSAVSRSLKLLEEEIGEALFDRVEGSALRLNPAGVKLFTQVRTAMRLVDDGLPHAASRRLALPAGVDVGVGGAAVRVYDDLAVAVQWLRLGEVEGVFVVGQEPCPEGVVGEPADVRCHWWARAAAKPAPRR